MGTAGGWLQWRLASSELCWSSTLEPTELLEGVSSCELLQLELALATEPLFSSLTGPEHSSLWASLLHSDSEEAMDQRFSMYDSVS